MFIKIVFKKAFKKVFFLLYFTLTIGVALYFTAIGFRHVLHFFESKSELALLKENKAKLVEEKAAMIAEKQFMTSDAYWEHLARIELGFVKKNETVYKLLYKK